jgi:hypothetical protein
MNEELLLSDVLHCFSEFAHLTSLCADLTGSQISCGLVSSDHSLALLPSMMKHTTIFQTRVFDPFWE